MKIIFLTLLFVSSIFAHGTLKEIHIALYGLDKKVANEKTVKKLIENLLSKVEHFYELKIYTFSYKDKNKLLHDIKTKKRRIDLVYMEPSVYIKNYNFFNKHSKTMISLIASDSIYIQYYILTNKNDKIKNYEDLKDKKVSFYSNHKLSKDWFLYNFYENTNKHYLVRDIKEFSNFNQHKKVLDLYFDKLDVAIVPKTVWDTSIELNPSLKNRIEVFDKSKAIYPSILGLFLKDSDPHIIFHHKDFLFDEKNKEKIEEVLSLVRYKGVKLLEKNSYEKAFKFYEEYKKIIPSK